MKAVVFDTGEHSVGGRAATRTSKDPSLHAEWISPSLAKVKNLNLTFDHAAQCFTATDPAFQQQVQAWLAAGRTAGEAEAWITRVPDRKMYVWHPCTAHGRQLSLTLLNCIPSVTLTG
jgi:predicted NAD/FAD-dependent oxidoreductase